MKSMEMDKKTVNILVAEDDDIDFKALKRAFKECEISNPVIRAEDGQIALDILKKGEINFPFILLVDLKMPRMDGFQLIDEIRNDKKLTKTIIFVLTTSDNENDLKQAYERHIAGYIIKSDFRSGFIKAIKMLDYYCEVIVFSK